MYFGYRDDRVNLNITLYSKKELRVFKKEHPMRWRNGSGVDSRASLPTEAVGRELDPFLCYT
jgi:hypothetical protein